MLSTKSRHATESNVLRKGEWSTDMVVVIGEKTKIAA